MNAQKSLDFARIASAIEYIRDNFRDQPSLEDIARRVSLSPSHFQRLFTDWAGVSPKKFLQYISIEYAKKALAEGGSTLFDTACETGLSGTGRLHDLFINIEGMTPGEYKNGGERLAISYNFTKTPFGKMVIASTAKGICHMAFVGDSGEEEALETLQSRFPNATYFKKSDTIQQNAALIFTQDWSKLDEIKLHLKGTEFQLKVWEALLKIPIGKLTTYSGIASHIDSPKASRAVGTAVGDNPVAFLIPCHRVIRSSGEPGGYHWGLPRKMAIIGWEAARGASFQ